MLKKFNELYANLISESIGKINVSVSLKCIKWASDEYKCEPTVKSTGEPYINAKAGWIDVMKGHGFQQSGWLNDIEEAAEWLYNAITEIQDSAPISKWPSTGRFRMRSSGFNGYAGMYRKYKDQPLPTATVSEGNKCTRWMNISTSMNINDNTIVDEWLRAWGPKAYKLNLD